MAALMSGAGARVGFTEVPELYRAVLKFDAGRSMIDNNLRIVEAFGFPLPALRATDVFRDEDVGVGTLSAC